MFKPGVMCFLNYRTFFPENIGKVVELLSFWGYCADGKRWWMCESRAPIKMLASGLDNSRTVYGTGPYLVSEPEMTPISGDDIDTSTTDEVKREKAAMLR